MPFVSLLPYAALFLASYLIGSIPVGLVVGKLSTGVDLREHGSGKTGATNALRVLGARLSVIVLVGDLIKGFLPTFAAAQWFGTDFAQVTAALGALIGHNWSVYIRFRGGRGVSTG